VSARRRFEQLRITPGAFYVFALEVGVSLIWLLSDAATKAKIDMYAVATPATVFEQGWAWTLVTSIFIERSFIYLLLDGVMIWTTWPILERFWGTARFYRFFVVTALLGSVAGTAMGFIIGRNVPIMGLMPSIIASVVAFGIIYARQPVRFFGALPMTARQYMFGFLILFSLLILLGKQWEMGAALAAACIAAVVMCSKKLSPGLAWKRWRIARARAKLSVIDGGTSKKSKAKDEQKWLN